MNEKKTDFVLYYGTYINYINVNNLLQNPKRSNPIPAFNNRGPSITYPTSDFYSQLNYGS